MEYQKTISVNFIVTEKNISISNNLVLINYKMFYTKSFSIKTFYIKVCFNYTIIYIYIFLNTLYMYLIFKFQKNNLCLLSL